MTDIVPVSNRMEIARKWHSLTSEDMVKYLPLCFPDCSERELTKLLFKMASMTHRPNPWDGEIHMVPFKSKETGQTTYVAIIDYKVYMRCAKSHPDFGSIFSGVIYVGDEYYLDENLIPIIRNHGPKKTIDFGWCALKLKSGGVIVTQAAFREYNKGTKIWRELPETMIAKIATKRACIVGLPGLGDFYIDGEEKAIQAVIDTNSESVEINHKAEKEKLYKRWWGIQYKLGQNATKEIMVAEFDVLCVNETGSPLSELSLSEIETMNQVIDGLESDMQEKLAALREDEGPNDPF